MSANDFNNSSLLYAQTEISTRVTIIRCFIIKTEKNLSKLL